jgi:TonB-dependent receptor
MFKQRLLCSSIAMVTAMGGLQAIAQTGSDSSAAIEEVAVTGVRASLSKSIDIKRQEFQIVDSIVAEDIGKFPDNNVVEALQRVSGVQVTDRGTGEVSTVSIRGLNDVTTTVNGRNIFTASGRSVALADIPASLLGQVDVYKTRSADLIASGIAGQIDIHTQRPFDFDGSKVVLATRGIYQEQAETTDPNISALASNRWDTEMGEFGALVNISYAKTSFRDQTVTAGAAVPFRTPDADAPMERLFPPAWKPGLDRGLPFAEGSTLADGTEYVLSRDAVFQPDFSGERERPAWNVSLQYAPNENSEYLFEAFYNGYRQKSFNSLMFAFVDWWGAVDPADPVEFYDGTNIVKERYVNDAFGFNSGDYTKGETDSYVYAFGGKWDVGDRLQIASEVVYQQSEFETEFFALQTNRGIPRLHVDFNNGDGIPELEFFDNPATPDVDESDLTDASLWNMGPMFDNANQSEGDAVTFTFDGDYDADWGIVNKVEFGLRYDNRGASESSRTASGDNCGGCTLSDFPGIVHITDGFYDGRADVPSAWAVADADWLEDNTDLLRAAYGLALGNALSLTQNFDIDETQTALYLQADFATELGGRELDGQFGLRYLTVDTDMKFTDVNTLDTSSASNNVSKILPSFMLRYHLTDDLMARMSYGETLRLPTFADLNSTIFYTPDVTDIGYGTASGGNSDLEPTESRNLDLSLEYYFGEANAVYATWFRRDIDGFVVPFRNAVQYDVPNDIPDIGNYT